jgi:quercetin dioxygenase-like cupin family protein
MLTAAMLVLAAQAATAVPPSTVVEVPEDHGAQNVVVTERTIAPGGETGWHVHPGYEICHVVTGDIEMRTSAGVARYKAGDTPVVPRGMPHDAVNVGTRPALLAVTFLVDRGAPVRVDTPAPAK